MRSKGTPRPRDRKPSVPPRELTRFLALVHPDPHSILGAHPVAEGVVVRAFRPGAAAVAALLPGDEPHVLDKVHEAGLFEGLLPGRGGVPAYRLEVRYPDGGVFTLRDPYSFLPSLGDLDLHLFNEGRHERLWEKFGARVREHQGAPGVSFAVWAPSARGVSVTADFNSWDGRLHPMRSLGASGIWELFVPDVSEGARYKYEIRTRDGGLLLKSDPLALAAERPPKTASVVVKSAHRFRDEAWMAARARGDSHRSPVSVYEVHHGSWRIVPEDGGRPLSYRELAPALADYALEMGFTHVEFLPVMEHPFGGSWGYQVSAYYAPTARYGTPDDFRFLVDHLHGRGIGVILDWVPAHFPKDEAALGRFDGTALYEHLDPRLGEHPDWGTFVFNYGRKEVRNFLLANALFWLDEFHADGLRLDAVASMLYLDYSRKEGEWVPNVHGGRENLDAVSFLKELNEVTHARHPGILMIAEESTSWPAVSRPTFAGGLGFGYKWNMGWMHDTLRYFSKDPVHRRFHHRDLTFGLLYAWSENFILPLSHDEVVHGKGSLLGKMPGDRRQKFANVRALFGLMWAYPGKKHLFMGGELGQWNEWNHDASLDWHLLEWGEHRGLQTLVRDLNRLYRGEPALFEGDHEPAGFGWIDAGNADENVVAFQRIAPSSGRSVIAVSNLAPVVRGWYRLGLPRAGEYREILNTDAEHYGGGNEGNLGVVRAEPVPHNGLPFSASIVLPPLATVWLSVPPGDGPES